MKITVGNNESGQRLDKFLKKFLEDVPLNGIYKHLRKKDIKVNGEKAKESYVLELNDVIELNKYVSTKGIKEKKAEKIDRFIRIDASNLKIVYEDANILVVEKWPGVLVHADSADGPATLTDFVLSYLHTKGDYVSEDEITFTPAPCNRLDRNTSGVVIFGKNYNALKAVNEMLREDSIQKFYYALVRGKIESGTYEAFIKKTESNNISKVYEEGAPDRKKIRMEVNVLQSNGAFSILEIQLITGRSHQLRAHLSHLGNPILGDPKYGDKELNSYFNNKYGLAFQFLYAYKLIFKKCPEDLEYLENKVVVEALPPIFKRIKKDVFKF